MGREWELRVPHVNPTSGLVNTEKEIASGIEKLRPLDERRNLCSTKYCTNSLTGASSYKWIQTSSRREHICHSLIYTCMHMLHVDSHLPLVIDSGGVWAVL